MSITVAVVGAIAILLALTFILLVVNTKRTPWEESHVEHATPEDVGITANSAEFLGQCTKGHLVTFRHRRNDFHAAIEHAETVHRLQYTACLDSIIEVVRSDGRVIEVKTYQQKGE